MTAAGPTLPRGDVLIRGSKITAIGTNLRAPADAEIIDARGRWITPGLIDPHSHIGVYPVPHVAALSDGNERTGPFKPEVRAEDSFWPQDPTIERALAGGVTTIHVLPGSANLVGGQGVTLRLVPGLAASEMRFPDAPTTMKMACGENPKRMYGSLQKEPATRMAEVAMLRQQLEMARAYKPESDEALDYGKDALARVLSGEILIQNHCYRADEMLLRLALFGEFGIAPRAFHHAVEAYKIGDQLAVADVAAVVWADWWGSKLELLDAVPANAALLDARGVRVSLHSDSERDVQHLNREAAKAWAAGRRAGLDLDRDRAIRWITANPAWVLGISDRVGTLEPGKEADLVIWSEDPFSVYSRADLVLIGGVPRYERARTDELPLSDFELGIRDKP
jgi:imidazolonepropionase-like amidohydrolase